MSNPLFNIQYGLFVITTCDDGRDNGCISNTVAQVTAQPNRISVALNKGNLPKPPMSVLSASIRNRISR